MRRENVLLGSRVGGTEPERRISDIDLFETMEKLGLQDNDASARAWIWGTTDEGATILI